MNQYIGNYLKRLKDYYTNLNKRQKRNIWLIGLFFLAVVIVLTVILMNPNYQVVFSNLDAKSEGQITTQLTSEKIPYQLQGSNILVPASMADKVRIDMAMAGLPSTGNVDYSSIFQQGNTFGMTSQELNLQVLNVLEQRLGQSISSINGIENAQVNIVMPTQQSFLVQQDTSSAKASVLLQVAPGYVLSSQQVFGIQQLVAHSVQGLSAENVSVVDQYGNDLTNTPDSSGNSQFVEGNQISSELSLRESVEQDLSAQIKSSLSNIVGANNVAVVVHANMSFNNVQQQQHVVKQGPMLSNQSSSSSSTGASSGGVAGQASTNPNLPNYATTGSGGGSSSNKSSTTNYDNTYTNTTTQLDPVQFNGYTVSVLVNSTAIKMTPQLNNSIRSYVNTAIGQAGNAAPSNITILSVPFATQNTTLATPAWYTSPLVLGGVGVLLIGGVLLFFLLRSRRKSAKSRLATESVATDSLSSSPPESPEAILTNELKDLANRRPDAFASLLRTWLSED